MSDETLATALLHARGLAVIERLPNRSYHAVYPLPAWLTAAFEHAAPGASATLAGAIPFLDEFLPLADTAWQRGADGQADSGPFAIDVDGTELLLRATACTIDGRPILILEHLTGEADTRSILRTARQHLLDAETLARQVSALHAPAATIDQEAGQIAAMELLPHQHAIVERLRGASEQLRRLLAGLPKPPETRWR